MTHFLILTFFGTALAVGMYCLWVSLRVELARVPRFLHIDGAEAYSDAYFNAMSGAGNTTADKRTPPERR
jgi:hypothetical protein